MSLVAGLRACAQLLQSWPWAKAVGEGRGAQRAGTPPPVASHAQGQRLAVPPWPRLVGEGLASAPGLCRGPCYSGAGERRRPRSLACQGQGAFCRQVGLAQEWLCCPAPPLG